MASPHHPEGWDELLGQVLVDHASLGAKSVGVEIVELPGPGLGCIWPKAAPAITKADDR